MERSFLVVLAGLLLASTEVVAQADPGDEEMSPAESGNPLPATDDEWRYTIAFPMIWAPDIDGKIRGGETVDFNISFRDILDQLSFGLMFELYANRGPYGLFFRSMYMQVEDEILRSGLLDARIQTDLSVGVNDLTASFRVHDKVRLLTGVRHVFTDLALDIRVERNGAIIRDERVKVADEDQFDFLVGINFNHWIDERWGLMLNSDAGFSGDNDRNFSAEFRALYRVNDLNNFWFGYRYLKIGNDTIEDGIKYEVDMIQSGPTIGWAYTFK